MLALIRKLLKEPAFVASLRDDWELRDQLIAADLNAVMALRSDIWAAAFRQKLPFKPVMSPSADRRQKAKGEAIKSLHDSILDQLRGKA